MLGWYAADVASRRLGAAIKANPSRGGDAKLTGLQARWPGCRMVDEEVEHRVSSQSAFTEEGLTKPARILLADDMSLFRSALRLLIDSHETLEVVAEAATGKEAIERCHFLRPDLVLMDIRMPEIDGITATRQIKRELPSTVVMVLTAFDDPDTLLEALEAGACGCILKDTPAQQFACAIREALCGESPMNQELAKQLLLHLVDTKKAGGGTSARRLMGEHSETTVLETLTARERETLKLMTKGKTNSDIARTLFISLSTAKQHVRHVIAKLGVSDRTQAAVKAIELGLLVEHERQWEPSQPILPLQRTFKCV